MPRPQVQRRYIPVTRTYYVSNTGSDHLNGLTQENAFATIQHAIDTVLTKIDTANNGVIIKLLDGIFNESPVLSPLISANPSANGLFRIVGNTASPNSVIIQGRSDSNAALTIHGPGRFLIDGVTIKTDYPANSTSKGYLIAHHNGARVDISNTIFSYSNDTVAVHANGHSSVNLQGNISFNASGDATGLEVAALASNNSVVAFLANLNIANTAANALPNVVGSFIKAEMHSQVFYIPNNVNGSISGVGFTANNKSHVLTNDSGTGNGNINILPGNVGYTDQSSHYDGTIIAKVNSQTQGYTLQHSDGGGHVYVANASNTTVTLPNSISQGFTTFVHQEGAGRLTFTAAAGASVLGKGGQTKSTNQYSVVVATVISNANGTNAAWRISGDIAV